MDKLRFLAPFLILALLGSSALAQPFRLKIVDSRGGIIPDARLQVGNGSFLKPDADGTIVIEATPPVVVHITAPGFAQQRRRLEKRTDQEITITLQPVPVHSTVDVVVRRPELGAGPLVSNAMEIDQTGARTVFDAVDKLVPSVSVTRRGIIGYGIASGGTGVMTIRGVGNSPNTGILVVVDGRPDYMGMMGHPLPDFYSLTDAETISVTQGPASVLYGTNAMGGAIDIKPSRPVEGFHTELSGELGSYWTGRYRLKHGGGFQRWFYNVTAGVEHTNGDRPSSNFRNQDGTVALGRNISRAWKTSIRGRYGHFVVEDPGTVMRPKNGSYATVGRGGFSWNLANSMERVWGNTRIFSSWGHHFISDGWRSNDRTTGGRIHENILVSPTMLLDVGTDVVNYGGQGWNVVHGRDFGLHDLTSAAGFGRFHWTPLPRIRFHTGVRYEHNSLFGGITVPEFGASFALADGYSLNLSVARGFRNPTIRELYLFPAPNPNLLPEHMWNYQASLQIHPNKNLTASVTGYYADLDNLIVLSGRWPNVRLLNGGAALNRGLDTNLRWRIGWHLAVNGGYAYLRSTNLAPYVPTHKGTYTVEISLGRAFLYLGGMTVNSRWANTRKTSKLDGYTVPTVKLMVPVNHQWTVFAIVDNFIDEDYQVVTGYPMPGVNAAGGFTLRF